MDQIALQPEPDICVSAPQPCFHPTLACSPMKQNEYCFVWRCHPFPQKAAGFTDS